MNPNANPDCISVGMLFATEFPTFICTWNVSPTSDDLNLKLNLSASAHLLDFEDLSSAQKRELMARQETVLGGSPTRRRPAQPKFEAKSKPAAYVENHGLLIFISHSSKDVELALALIELLRAGLGLHAHQIRCSSVDGYRLPVGVNTESRLREEVNAARVVIGLITPSSLSSAFVMFELGARWGANNFLAPLLAGVAPGDLSGPLSLLNALSASNEAHLHQLLMDVSNQLSVSIQSPASYVRYVAAVQKIAVAVSSTAIRSGKSRKATTEGDAVDDLAISFQVQGTPPSRQTIAVRSNQLFAVTRVDYLLSDETSIASEACTLSGTDFDIPISDDAVLKVYNTPRHDRHQYDGSGPMKVRVIGSINGKTRPYLIPLRLQLAFHGSTAYRQVIGARDFYGDHQ